MQILRRSVGWVREGTLPRVTHLVGRGRLTVNLEEEISCSEISKGPSVRKCRFWSVPFRPSASLLAPCLFFSISISFFSSTFFLFLLPPFLSSFRTLSHTHLTPLNNHSPPSVFTLTRSSSDNAFLFLSICRWKNGPLVYSIASPRVVFPRRGLT